MIKQFATVSLFTLLSRVLGFFRDRLLASVLGAGLVADAYLMAFQFPNLFRRIFAEGAFNTAFVPVYTRKLTREGQASAASFANQVLTLLILALLLVTALVEITMPWIIRFLAPGFSDIEGKAELAILLSHITFPYLIFASLMAMFSGMLNAHNRFGVAAFAPALLNVVLWACLFIADYYALDALLSAHFLAWSLTVAGIIQAALVVVAVQRMGFKIRLAKPRLEGDVRTFLILGLPALMAGGIVQINIVVGSMIASTQAGAVSHLYYADRLYQLPLGLVGAAVGVVLLPLLTRKIYEGKPEAVIETQNRAFDLAMLITIPAAVGLAVLSQPLVSAIFEHGLFTATDSLASAAALWAFAFGLPAFVLIKVFQPAYFARENIKTPTVLAGVNAATNIGLSLALMPFFGHVGIAMATSAASWLNVLFLVSGLVRCKFFVPDKRLLKRLFVAVSGAIIMAITVDYLADIFKAHLDVAQASWVRFSVLILIVMAGVSIYGLVVTLGGAVSLSDLRNFRRRT